MDVIDNGEEKDEEYEDDYKEDSDEEEIKQSSFPLTTAGKAEP